MGFESIFAWNALPEAGFSKKALIDGHRFSHSDRVPDSAHRKPSPDVFQAQEPSNLRCGLHRARESVCRVSGFVQVGFEEVCFGTTPAGIGSRVTAQY